MSRLFRFFVIPVLAVVGSFSIAAAGAAEQLCNAQDVAPAPDGRMLGHLPYAEAAPATLVAAPAGFAVGQPCKINRDVAPHLLSLLAAAHKALGASGNLRGVSCFRSIAHQRAVFCSKIGPQKHSINAVERAEAVAPPGHSEHHTGYAIDFGTRPSPNCSDVNACFAATPAGRWMLAHAPEYGFELSFPAGNTQGVEWEPWHWRWVGVSLLQPGADKARALFARARTDYPAQPATPDTSAIFKPAPPVVNGVPIPPPESTPPHFGPPPPIGN